MYREEISMIQIGLLMGSFFVSGAGLYYHGFLLHSVAYNPWAPLLSGVALSVIPLALAWRFCARFPRDNIVGVAQKLTGRWLGIMITLPLVLFHLALPWPVFRIAAELLVDVHLNQTPPIVLSTILLAIACWLALMGTEVVTRTNDEHLVIIFPLTVVMFYLSIADIRPELALPLTQFDFSYWGRLDFYASLMVFFGFSLPLFLNDALGHSKKMYWVILAVTIVGALYLLFTLFLIIGTLGMEMASSFEQPLKVKMTTLRQMVFFERVDIFLVLLWMFPTITAMGAMIVTGARAVGQWLNLANYHPVIYVYFVIALLARPWFEAFQHSTQFLRWLGPLWGVFMIATVGLLLILARFRREKTVPSAGTEGE
ncbi:spore germination protein kb, putative [Heliomicrobium modesticaldum Ice1]|uniref:Spore germination protein kb, putative n=2 Tax=Heliomicrobium modesticaldum TaxID=35701 RepID=B0TED8_HELMI|nr:spore germination protein kb, putative [Heliomicrobium modesticaldum Ice1]